MNTKLKPIETPDAFFKAYAQAVTILKLTLESDSPKAAIRFTSRAEGVLQDKPLCPVTAVAYMRTHIYHALEYTSQAVTLAAISKTVATTVIASADNQRACPAFDPNVRKLLLEPFLHGTSRKS